MAWPVVLQGVSDYPDLPEPATALEPIDCSAWGCTEEGYGWRYLIDPSLARD